MHSIYSAEGAFHLHFFRDLDFSLVSEIVNGVPLDAKRKNQQVSYRYAAQDQKRQNNDDIINKPRSKPNENSYLGIGTLVTLSKLTDEMDPNSMSSMYCCPSVKKGVINGHGHLLPQRKRLTRMKLSLTSLSIAV
jgi:hypothetical protein